MLAYIATWAALRTDSRAVTALEYAMIAGVVVAVIAVGFGTIGTDLAAKFKGFRPGCGGILFRRTRFTSKVPASRRPGVYNAEWMAFAAGSGLAHRGRGAFVIGGLS
jgi:Flp pilus assembly pilin Flp